MKIVRNCTYIIPINYSGFPCKCLSNLPTVLEFKGRDLEHAILTCGIMYPLTRASDVFKYKKYLLGCQLRWKLDVYGRRKLFLSSDYVMYDPSEKVCLSYYRGMIFGCLLAHKLFGITYFVNLSTFERSIKHNIRYRTKLRPDIIAWNKNNYSKFVVWECKSNINGLGKGKAQANSIKKINGSLVHRAIVSAVYPAKNSKQICASINDPDGEGREIEVDINSMLEYYYRPVVNLIQEAPSKSVSDIGEMQFTLAEMEEEKEEKGKEEKEKEKYKIGLPTKIFEYFTNEERDKRKTLEYIIAECMEVQLEVKENIYDDFIYIE